MTIFRRVVAIMAFACLFAVQPVRAQTILRDAETEALFADMTRPIIEAAGLSPKNVQVVVLQDPEINAFVAGGQIVYINSGLIEAAQNANEVQGVFAHELGHVVGGHAPLSGRMGKSATGITIASLLLGAVAAAAGSGDAAMGAIMAGQRAAVGSYLAYSRTQEASADAAGASFLNKAKVSGKGMLDFFKTLQNQEYRYAVPQDEESSFNRSHPLTADRIAALTQTLQSSPAWGTPVDPDLEKRFERVKAKLAGYVEPFNAVMRDYPPSDPSLTAHYARAYAYHRAGYPAKADAEAAALVMSEPDNPYFLEVQGQILMEAGNPQGALDPLRKAVRLSDNSPLIATTFGHALVATDDPANLDEAEAVLRQAVGRDDSNPFAWVQLGTVYERRGDIPHAALAKAELSNLTGDTQMALVSAKRAMQGLPEDSADWLRAQDISMVSQNELDDKKRH
ncbi:M48 family metalloprotease [Stakelama sp. CBK3Z-3]|uniref:M48 family metalloprotease n=1 Tax=Stakelama flava TaxID=2860338 RepID=A0ABS6XM35_9SPHN|nr:M48 family metalloprotease [Stakelama flava]MBW4331221.1 M48 family metalloprotease [Stakelama flava]